MGTSLPRINELRFFENSKKYSIKSQKLFTDYRSLITSQRVLMASSLLCIMNCCF